MNTFKQNIEKGNIVKFHTPLPDEDPDQKYVVLEVNSDSDRPRVDIKPLGTNLKFPPINTVPLKDLEVVEVDTSDLMGHQVSILTPNNKEETGVVIDVEKEVIFLDLIKEQNKVRSNVELTIQDKNGNTHSGTLIIS